MKNWENLDADENLILNTHYTPGRQGRRIDRIVLHHNGGNLSIRDCWNVWQTREASAHYQVDANGRVGQLVWDDNTAWHAGDWDTNLRSIGIEHADISSAPWRISDATLDNGAHLVAALCKKYGLGRPQYGRNVFFHRDFSPTECPASIAGSQRDAYFRRAGEWYDRMTGHATTTNKPAATQNTAATIEKEKTMGTQALLFRKAGTDAIYIAYLGAGCYRLVHDMKELKAIEFIYGKTGGLKTWAQVMGKKNAGYGDITADDMKAFGYEMKENRA